MKYANELKAIKKLSYIFSGLFWILVALLIFLLIGAIVIVVTAISFRGEEEHNLVIYLLLSYVITLMLALVGFFFNCWLLNRYLKKNPVAVLLYPNGYQLRNPFHVMKEAKQLKLLTSALKSGIDFKEAKNKYF